MEAALRLRAADVIHALKRQHPALWARWEGTGEATLAPVMVPTSRGDVPDDETPATVALHGPRAAAALPDGHSVALAMGPSNVQGPRWWWLCPRTGDRCAALYLPDGAERFASRRAHRLRYSSTAESPAERAARRARALRRTLGDFTGALGCPLPDRPPRMRAATHERLCAEIREAEARALAVPAWLLARAADPG